ncbi:MAG: hypothetical protein AAF654_04985 [Myxococcota bacterium]
MRSACIAIGLGLTACAHTAEDTGRLPDYQPMGYDRASSAYVQPTDSKPATYAMAAPAAAVAPAPAPTPPPEPAVYDAPVEPVAAPPPVAPSFATLDVESANAEPCDVFVRGRPVGQTPIIALEVPVGDAFMEVDCPERERYEDTLNFRPGEQLKLVVVSAAIEAKPAPRKKKRKKRRRRRKRR